MTCFQLGLSSWISDSDVSPNSLALAKNRAVQVLPLLSVHCSVCKVLGGLPSSHQNTGVIIAILSLSRDTLGPAEAARPRSNRQPGCGAGQNKPRGLMKISDRWRGESPGSTLLIDRSLTKFMTNDVMRLICVPRNSLPAPIKAITQLVSSPHHGPTYTLAAVTRTCQQR